METFSASLALCVGNSPATGEFPSQRPVTQSFDIFVDVRLNNGWVNNREAGDLRRYRTHYDVTVMSMAKPHERSSYNTDSLSDKTATDTKFHGMSILDIFYRTVMRILKWLRRFDIFELIYLTSIYIYIIYNTILDSWLNIFDILR